MSAASVQCPVCFTRSPAPTAGAVVCSGCSHSFTPSAAVPPARKNPAVPYARALPVGGTPAPQPAHEPADEPRPARRAREGDDDRPRPRTRSHRKSDDEPANRGGSALPLVLIAGGVLAVLTVGGMVAVVAVLFTRASPNTSPVAVAGPSWATAPDAEVEPDPFGHRREKEVERPIDPRFPEPPSTAKVPQPTDPLKGDANGNALVTRHKAKLLAKASSQWVSWPATHLLDGDEKTSWYSNSPDNTFNGSNPWVLLTFPEDVSVKRVTVLGNRDPTYATGYTVTEGKVDLLDADDKVIATHDLIGAGEKCDFDLKLAKPTAVRAIRFTMTKSRNGDCGLGEFQVE